MMTRRRLAPSGKARRRKRAGPPARITALTALNALLAFPGYAHRMRKLALALLLLAPAPAFAAEGKVMLVTVKCHDLFVVEMGEKRYALLEWYGGYRPEKGDILTGNFVHFGVQDMYVGQRRLRVWVSDYDLTQDQINDRLADRCG